MITEIQPCHRSALTHYQNTDCNIFTFAGALWHAGTLKLLCGSRVCFAQCLQQMDPCLLVMFAPLGGYSVEDEVSEGWFLLRCWPSLSSLSCRHHHRLHSHISPFFFPDHFETPFAIWDLIKHMTEGKHLSRLCIVGINNTSQTELFVM